MYFDLSSCKGEFLSLLDREYLIVNETFFVGCRCNCESCIYKRYLPITENCTLNLNKFSPGQYFKTKAVVLQKDILICPQKIGMEFSYNSMQQALDYEFLKDLQEIYNKEKGFFCKNLEAFKKWLIKKPVEKLNICSGVIFVDGQRIF